MEIIDKTEPFGLKDVYLKITHRFTGLPHHVVSGNKLVQLRHFKYPRTRPMKVIEQKVDGRLKYFRIDGRKVSRFKLKSRIYKNEEIISI